MPNIQSAKKRVLVIEKKTMRNQMLKSSLKSVLKKFDTAVSAGDAKLSGEVFKEAVKKVDQAVSKGILHKNTASRKKSQLTKKINGLGA
ncbi:30S ribosomal protein S20 [bioreactor metagenome]|uniref:30S ribosomal protein S20 n=1 Tax=bioreactor metagenome TaxID=1076179 RepID=A0A645FKS7_9ZZZZ